MGTDKLLLRRNGSTLIDTVIEASREALAALPATGPIVVVGPETGPTPRPGVSFTREDPPGGGPVAAIDAGVTLLHGGIQQGSIGEPQLVAIFAGDAPDGPGSLSTLVSALEAGTADAVVFVGVDGRRQPLCGVYRMTALTSALADLGDPHGASLKDLLTRLKVHELVDTTAAAADIDTPEQARNHGFSAP